MDDWSDGVLAVAPVFVRAPWNYDRDAASLESALVVPPDEVSRTQQQFAEEVDINTIVKRFGLTGEIPGDFDMPQSGDFTDVVDFQTAMNMIVAAQSEFMSLPGPLRARFGNDPQRLIEFLDDGGNLEEARRLGLVRAAEVTRTGDVPPVAVP